MATKKKTPKKVVKADPKAKSFDEAFALWKEGKRICDLAKGLGVRRGALRRQFRKRAGGKEAFKALRTKGAGGLESARFGARPKSASLDKDAKLIPIGGRADWTYRHAKDSRGESFYIASTGKSFPGGSGQEFVRARATEAADYLAEMGNGLPHARLVRYIGTKASK